MARIAVLFFILLLNKYNCFMIPRFLSRARALKVPVSIIRRPNLHPVLIRKLCTAAPIADALDLGHGPPGQSNTVGIDSTSAPISQALYDHLLEHLTHSLKDSKLEVTDPREYDQYAQSLHQKIMNEPTANTSNKDLAAFGLGLCKDLTKLSAADVAKVCSGEIPVSSVIAASKKQFEASKVIFETITNHHRAISKEDWRAVATDSASLAAYSAAASAMGTRKWVMDCNDWMETFALSFFKYGTARRHFVREHQRKHDPEKKHANTSSLVKQLVKDLTSVDNPHGTRIKLLDVGSCYNPIGRSDNTDVFDVTALDLYPADPSVYQCDFLNVDIGDVDSQPQITPIQSDDTSRDSVQLPSRDKQRLTSLPKGSFDVVTMSLVLNYLPSPEQRLAMIRNARALLRTPPAPVLGPGGGITNSPHSGGLLLIAEKESIFGSLESSIETVGQNKMALLSSWKQAIINEGFSLVKYQVLASENKRTSHVFAFAATNPAVDPPVCAEANQQEAPKMWIRQDFDVFPDATHASPSDDGDEETLQDRIKKYRASIAGRRPVGIVGGGIGGSALALSLQHKNIPFIVFEKDASFDTRKQGYALTMQQGGPALKALGLGDLLQTIGTVSTNHSSFRWDGARLGTYGLTKRMPVEEGGAVSIACNIKPDQNGKGSGKEEKDAKTMEVLLKARDRHNVHVPRQKLREIMMQKIDPLSIQWSKKLRAIEFIGAIAEQVDNGTATTDNTGSESFVRVHFEDGTSSEVSALVGADGIYSTVRSRLEELLRVRGSDKTVLGEDTTDKLKYLGVMVILGIAPNEPHSAETADAAAFTTRVQCQWLDGETRVFSMPYDANHTMWQLSFPCDEAAAQALSGVASANTTSSSSSDNATSTAQQVCLRNEALRRCEGWDPKLVALLTRADPHLVSGHPVYDRDPCSLNCLPADDAAAKASNGTDTVLTPAGWPVTLLGDAAHPMSPFKGQGANQAILDALALSKAISSSSLYAVQRFNLQAGGASTQPGRRSIAENLRLYEADMYAKGAEKVQRSRDAAYYLHHECALAEGDMTRAKAAEEYAAQRGL